ncbi:MAG TPA: PEPxxWA-CTERM sorting domain-containing protein [Roseiarcus sp.]
MKILKILSSAMFCVAGLAAFGATADAAVVPVADPYFDMFPAGQSAATYFEVSCGTGCAFADKTIVGWNSSVTRAPTGDSGQWQIGQVTNNFNGDPLIGGTTPEPIVVRAINATVSQVVSTAAVAGVTYTLDVDLGFEKTNPDLGFVDLLVGGNLVKATPLASYGLTQAQMQESGNWYDFEASYTASAADANDPIEILLSAMTNGAGFSFFGNVRLTDSLVVGPTGPMAAPEPATWAMMLLGFGGIAGVAAVRRSSQRRSAVGQLA